MTKQINDAGNWEEAEAALRLVSELSDLHVKVLTTVVRAPMGEGTFGNVRVVSLGVPIGTDKGKALTSSFQFLLPRHSDMAIRLACSELVARGLLKDEGIGRIDVRAMQYFVATDLAEWLMSWIQK